MHFQRDCSNAQKMTAILRIKGIEAKAGISLYFFVNEHPRSIKKNRSLTIAIHFSGIVFHAVSENICLDKV